MQGKSNKSTHSAAVKRAEWVARILDSGISIPGTEVRIGLDPIIGIIPGIGDVASMLVSAAVVFDAARIGVPNHVLFRMLGNIAIDSTIGAIPIFGDLFDFAWKSNDRNLELLRSSTHLSRTDENPMNRIVRMAIVLVALAVLFIVVVALGLIFTISKIVSSL